MTMASDTRHPAAARRFWLGIAAYLVPTFPIAFVWHLVLFEPNYRALQIYRADPIIPFGLAAMLIQMAVSRSREYGADETGAKLVGYPDGLASALRKLHVASQRIPMPASPSTAHLFIVNPLSGRGFAGLFSTHPPLEDRVARLLSNR